MANTVYLYSSNPKYVARLSRFTSRTLETFTKIKNKIMSELQQELPLLPKWSKKTITAIFAFAIFAGLGVAVTIASIIPSEEEQKAIEYFNIQNEKQAVHEEVEQMREYWAELDSESKDLEAELFQSNLQ